MPEVQVTIGGREFTVACQAGEEPFLQTAAKMLDTEAAVILGQIGRMPPDRMLLMAGLMLADKTAALEDEVQELRDKLEAREKSLRSAEERLADRARRITELQEAAPAAAGLPEAFVEGFEKLALKAEELAETAAPKT